MILGPLTYTNEEGKTTIYGIDSGQGAPEDSLKEETREIYSRVAESSALEWIQDNMKRYR